MPAATVNGCEAVARGRAGKIDWRAGAGKFGALLPQSLLHPAALAGAARFEGKPWAIAFSGGADSLSLLLLLWQHWPGQRARLRVLHFNHRLRGREAARDEAFCRGVCASLGVKFISGAWQRPRREKVSEASARTARHAFFAKVMTQARASVLWLGHQQDDIAETMLMRIARGSGAGGLSAPRPDQAMPGGRHHVRPLLGLKHAELEASLRACGLRWCEDATNGEGDYFRNRVRRDVIPAWLLASGRDALAGAALSRELLEETEEACEAWLDELAPITPHAELMVKNLMGKPRALWRRALHRWLMLHPKAGVLSRQGFEALLGKLMAGASTRFSLGTRSFAVLKKGTLRFEQHAEPFRKKTGK